MAEDRARERRRRKEATSTTNLERMHHEAASRAAVKLKAWPQRAQRGLVGFHASVRFSVNSGGPLQTTSGHHGCPYGI